jgi:NitT/TauT family transport system permease protein
MTPSTAAARPTGAAWGSTTVGRVLVAVALIAVWEACGRSGDPTWFSMPSLIARRLFDWLLGDLWLHAATTVAEMAIGLAIGMPSGIAAGLALGQSPRLATVLRPVIVGFYSVPLVTMAPLLILWFGIDLQPKIVLVAVVSFFLLFFNTLAGVQSVDRDLVAAMTIMGADRRELFLKLMAPACTQRILSGVKIALPYAVIAATVGEMSAARQGLGFLLTQAAAQIDMTGVYAALLVLMALGVAAAEAADRLERRLLRWRGAAL